MKIIKKFPESVNSLLRANNNSVRSSHFEDDIKSHSLTDEEELQCSAYVGVIKLYLEYLNKNGKGKESREKFVNIYNGGAYPELMKYTGAIGSWKTIERWKVDYKRSGNDMRIFMRSKRKRGMQVTPEQSAILIKYVLNPNKPIISEAIRMAIEEFKAKDITPILSSQTYRRYLDKWKVEHYADWVFYREGEQALDDKVLPYLERDYDRIEVGDIIVADGHKLNFEIINPYTGKPKRMMLILYFDMKSSMPLGWEIDPSENTQAIKSALRRSIIRLGKYPKVVYMDNGRAFNADYFTKPVEMLNIVSTFERLGIKTITAIPYHGQSKTIERFFRTFGELERLAPTYVGASISSQPPRMHRGEKLHVKLYEKLMSGTTIDIFAAHKAIAWWFDQYAHRVQQNGHLKGLTPAEVFEAGKGPGVDKEELDFLMMKTRITTVYRNGIRMFNGHYWNEALFGKKWDEVLVRYDIQNTDSIYVYDKNDNFICKAERVEKVHPAAVILGDEEDVRRFRERIEMKARMKKPIVSDAREFLKQEVYPAVKEQFETNVLQIEAGSERQSAADNKPAKIKKKKRDLIDSWSLPEDAKIKNIDLIPKAAEG
ncbi:Mu transposase C-terminal domain-containing protein [Melioribacter sp. OK-6-Me]|uniref:Mu transposase C-terminal domain-containing protein n=1 Tax=unclassified Melioribacter TaxID=2627329 RepID=UPI003ED9917D